MRHVLLIQTIRSIRIHCRDKIDVSPIIKPENSGFFYIFNYAGDGDSVGLEQRNNSR